MNKVVRRLAAVIVTAVALAGCAQNPSYAATVDGVVITEQAVQRATDVVAASFGVPESEARTFAVNRVIQGVLSDRMAADNGISITQVDRAQVLAGQPQLAALAQRPDGAEFADQLIKISVVAGALDSRLPAELAKHDVRPNPRYGTWDPTTGSLTGTGSLSTQVAAEK